MSQTAIPQPFLNKLRFADKIIILFLMLTEALQALSLNSDSLRAAPDRPRKMLMPTWTVLTTAQLIMTTFSP